MSGKFIDAYSVLQIGPEADDAAVRARHRELAKQFHPDRGGRAADGQLMMRINRARDVLLDPVARATLDEELARRRREATPPNRGASQSGAGDGQPAAPGAKPPSRDRRWRAEWGSASPWATPPPGSASPGPVPPRASRMRPSANRLRQTSKQVRGASPALSARPQPAAPKPPRRADQKPPAPAPRAAAPRPADPRPADPRQAAPPPPPTPQPMSPPPTGHQPPRPATDKPANAWSLYAVPLDGVSVAALLASVLMCGPLGFILGIIGLARTADDKRRGRWAAVAGIAISSLTMLMVIGYVMQAMSAPGP